jgi:hypothetical protein
MLGQQRELGDINDELARMNKMSLEESMAVAARCWELRERNAFLEMAFAKEEVKAMRYRKLISMYTSVDEEVIDLGLERLIKERKFWR